MGHVPSINEIYYGLQTAKALAERVWWNASGATAIDNARKDRDAIDRALAEYSRLSEAWPRLRDHMAHAAREYDRYVTRGHSDEPQGCSCHLSAPCSWCTRDADSADDTPSLTQGGCNG